MHDVAVDVGQPVVATLMAVSQSRVIDAKQVKAGGMEVVNMNGVLDNPETKFVGRPVGKPAFDTSTGHPNAEALLVVVASGSCSALTSADCGIGLVRAGDPPPWGADLICGEDLSDVRFIINACVMARDIAKQSVNIALGAATLGALVSAGGILPMTTRRVMAVVNTATLVSMANGVRASAALARRPLPPPPP